MKRLVSLFCALAGAAACGDNLGNGPAIDAATDGVDVIPDARTDASTAPTVGGTLAVFDATLTHPLAAAVGGVRGGTIRYSFNDLTMAGGETIFGTSAIGGCLITRFDATHLPNPRLNAGDITVSAPATGTSALLKTVGPCTLQPLFGDPDPYVCISNNVATGGMVAAQDLASSGLVAYVFGVPSVNFGTTPAVTITSIARATNVVTVTATAHGYAAGMNVTIAGVTGSTDTFNGRFAITTATTNTFTYAQASNTNESGTGGTSTTPTNAIVGSAVVVNGFANAAFNSGASAFPVIGQLDANTLVLSNSAPADGAGQALSAATYTVLNGFSPIPLAAATANFAANANFLGGSAAPNQTASIRIQKAANGVWPAIDQTIDVPGEARVPVALTTVTAVGTTVTATTAVPHDFLVGQRLAIAGVVDSTYNVAGDGITTGAVVVTSTTPTFTYVLGAAPTTAASTGGTAVKPGAFALDSTSQLAHVFPTTATALKYSCDNNTLSPMVFDDTCGDESTALLRAMIVSGSATKKSVQGLFPFQMPTEIPGTDSWLEWQCAQIGGRTNTMPLAAVQAIIDFQPTRIEQQVLFVGGTILDGTGTNVQTLRVLAGHAIAGQQTFCPRAGTLVAPATIAMVARVDSTNVATITTSAPHSFVPLQSVTITGVSDTTFNQTFTITSVPKGNGISTTFTVTDATAADVAGLTTTGTVTAAQAFSGLSSAVCP